MKLSYVAAAVALSTLLVPQMSRSADARTGTTDAPIAFQGTLPKSVAARSVAVNVLPDTARTRRATNGDTLRLATVARSRIAIHGRAYVVRIDPARISPGFVEDDGVVTFEVVALGRDGRQSFTTTTSARIVDAGQRQSWAGADASSSPSARHAAPASPVVADRLTAISPVVPDRGARTSVPAANCVGPNPRKTQIAKKVAWSTIGTTYAIGNSTGTMQVSSSKGATYGLAVSGSGQPGAWSAGGTKKLSGGWGFNWKPIKGSRSYQKQVEYRKYKIEYLDSRCNRYTWEPIVETGGTGSTIGIDRPNFTRCQPVDPGEWYRDRGDGHAYTLGTAVKLTSLIGIDLSIERQYSSSQKLTYNIVGKKRMCGSDAYPSFAGKVMERVK